MATGNFSEAQGGRRSVCGDLEGGIWGWEEGPGGRVCMCADN